MDKIIASCAWCKSEKDKICNNKKSIQFNKPVTQFGS